MESTNSDASNALRRGLTSLGAGDRVAAIDMLHQATALDPHLTAAWTMLGVVEIAGGNLGAGVEALTCSLDLEPDQPEIRLNLATALYRLGRLGESAAMCRQILSVNDGLADAYQVLGLVETERGNYGESARCFGRALQGQAADANLWASYGSALLRDGKLGQAAEAFEQACVLDPGLAAPGGMAEFALFVARAASGAGPAELAALVEPKGRSFADLKQFFKTAFLMLSHLGETEAAGQVGDVWVASPANCHEARHHRNAARKILLERAPPAYVVELFDAYADRFDEHLTGALGYRLPLLIADTLWRMRPAKDPLDIIDIGCGSGLCSVALKSRARSLTGIDLSPRMIERAEARHIFDELIVGDVLETLAGLPRDFDLVVAGDLLIYLGAIEPLFRAVAARLRPGGLFVFSVEAAPDIQTYRLDLSGRFSHAPGYIRAAAREFFTERSWSDITVRVENLQPVQGYLVIVERR